MTSRPRPARPVPHLGRPGPALHACSTSASGTIVAALLLLVSPWGATWYGDHLSSAASVNGQTITKDAFAQAGRRQRVPRRTTRAGACRTLLAAGHIRATDAESRKAIIDQRLGQADTISLEQLVDGTIQAELARKQGVTVTDADVDARITEEATTPELRHAWMIAVAPELRRRRDAAHRRGRRPRPRPRPTQALADLKAGKDWDTSPRPCPRTRPRTRPATSPSSTRTPRSTRPSSTP